MRGHKPTTMQFSSRQFADVAVAAPVGRIDHGSAAELEHALSPLLAAGRRAARARWCSISPASTTSAASACAC